MSGATSGASGASGATGAGGAAGAAHEDPRLAAAYQRGNELPAASMRAWAELIVGSAPEWSAGGDSAGDAGEFGGGAADGLAVLEVGSGTGMFCAALAQARPAARVTGVEPSAPMLAEAELHNPHPRVRYLAGPAEALPVPDGSYDLALLSRVVHHLPDRPLAARELARALRPGGRLVIRTTVRERLDALVYHFWPRLLETDAERFPSEAEILADFTPAGFTVHRVHAFAQPVAADLREWREQVVGRAQSKFLALSEAEFEAGLARLDAALQAASGEVSGEASREVAGGASGGAEPSPGLDPGAPVQERYDVIVLDRTPVRA
ncbi:methyltransferase domain-containing protein [Kitasatospora sp. NBC_01287]|uniref:methyltransferase domain-containing protein n=1 Tax=Kitasatospora sp. NBC_01287 TaxID=2903573 RepID=UPI00224F7A51|nr:methyltransferase domain-containing protein [Kitasatospora sp. NBC_01287]MCX4745057.1 methyltransferase domain-containing protein [Kitasatospora sp. NBC_01287]